MQPCRRRFDSPARSVRAIASGGCLRLAHFAFNPGRFIPAWAGGLLLTRIFIRAAAQRSEVPEASAGMARLIKVATIALMSALCGVALCVPGSAADPAFRQWLEALWPDAQAFGISRKTFDAA